MLDVRNKSFKILIMIKIMRRHKQFHKRAIRFYKIIRQIKELNPDIFLVGFKAEVNISKEDIIASAKQQIKDAGTDLVIANDVSDENCHFGSDNNKVWIVDGGF